MDKNKCNSCGETKCSCKNKEFTKAVIEIDNPEQITLMRRVVIPVSMGDDTTVPPTVGKYKNVLLFYEANSKSYLYSSDGIPTLLANGITDYEQAVNLPQINGTTLIGNKTLNEIGIKAYVFDTVADMKASTDLVDGDYAKTLGFHTINDGGGALYKIINDTPSTYYETLASGIYAELITDIANVKMFGAKADGITDDAPSIRKAIAYLKTVSKPNLYFPSGTYYINSGDPRGLSTATTHSGGDYYTCFEVLNNMKIYGDGKSSVLLYNSNRIGYNLTTLRGDVGAIFANFRVNGTDNYAVNSVEIRDIKVEYTELAAGEKGVRDYIDGQLIRVNTDNVSDSTAWHQGYNGNFLFENISVENMPGHQIFNISGAKRVVANNIDVHNIGKITNTANTDHSSFFINAIDCNITNSTVHCDSQSSGTAFELHSANGIITDCYVENVSTFTNVVGNVSGYDSNYLISNNLVKNVFNFTRPWIHNYRYINSVTVENNDVTLSYESEDQSETLFRAYTEGGVQGTEQPIDTIIFNNNKCTTNITDSTLVNSATNYDAAIHCQRFKKLIIKNNEFRNFRRQLTYLTENNNNTGTIELVDISNNNISKIGMLTETTFSVNAIYLNIPPCYASNNVKKSITFNNNVIDLRDRNGTSSGIYLNFRSGATDTNTTVNTIDNSIVGATTEITFYNKNATGIISNGILLIHEYHNIASDTISALVCGSEISGFVIGSKVRGQIESSLFTNEVLTSTAFKQTLYASALPSSGYFQKGAIIYNTNASFNTASPYAWICTTAGTAGTDAVFKPINPDMN